MKYNRTLGLIGLLFIVFASEAQAEWVWVGGESLDRVTDPNCTLCRGLSTAMVGVTSQVPGAVITSTLGVASVLQVLNDKRKVINSPVQHEAAAFILDSSKLGESKVTSPVLAQAISDQRKKLAIEGIDSDKLNDYQVAKRLVASAAE